MIGTFRQALGQVTDHRSRCADDLTASGKVGLTPRTGSAPAQRAPVWPGAGSARLPRAPARRRPAYRFILGRRSAVNAQAILGSSAQRMAQRGDTVVVTAGLPFGQPGSTNMLRIETVAPALSA